MGKWTDELENKEQRDAAERSAKRDEDRRTNRLIDEKGAQFWKETIEWLALEITDLARRFPDRPDRNLTFRQLPDRINVLGGTFPQMSLLAPLVPSGKSLLIHFLEHRNRFEQAKETKTEVAISLDPGEHVHFDYEGRSYIHPADFGGYLLGKVLRLA